MYVDRKNIEIWLVYQLVRKSFELTFVMIMMTRIFLLNIQRIEKLFDVPIILRPPIPSIFYRSGLTIATDSSTPRGSKKVISVGKRYETIPQLRQLLLGSHAPCSVCVKRAECYPAYISLRFFPLFFIPSPPPFQTYTRILFGYSAGSGMLCVRPCYTRL